MTYPRRNKKQWTCYPPDYKPGDGYKTVHSNFQMKKTLRRYGAGSEAFAKYLAKKKYKINGQWSRSISFWNMRDDDYGVIYRGDE